MFTGCYLASAPLPGAGGGGDDDDGDTLVTFSTSNPPTQNGSATETTTAITFTLSEAIAGLTADDITLTGVAGVTKGTLSGAGPTYTLPISGFTAGGTLTITITKTGYTISGSQTVTIYYYSGSHTHSWNTETGLCDSNCGELYYDLGDTGPGGGKIFYRIAAGFTMTDDNSTAHYLEAAPADMSTTLKWALSTTSPGTETAIGTGRKNTALILAVITDAPAAKECDDYSNGGKNDWFLPSKDELNQLWVNRTSVGNLTTTVDSVNDTHLYWSSSEDDVEINPYGAWDQRFSDGNPFKNFKNSAVSVRAIRAF